MVHHVRQPANKCFKCDKNGRPAAGGANKLTNSVPTGFKYKKKEYPVHYGYIILTFEKNMNMQVIERKCIVHKLTLTETDTLMCTHAPRSYRAHTSLFINTKIVSYRYTHCVSLPLPSFFHLVIPHLQHTSNILETF